MKNKSAIGLTVIFAIFILIGISACGELTPPGAKNSNIEILNSNETLSAGGLRTIHVEVRNNSDNLCTALALKSIYYDETKKMVGTGNGTAVNIPAHSTKVIDCIALNVENVKTYTLQVDMSMFE
jgi:hypothetical protein